MILLPNVCRPLIHEQNSYINEIKSFLFNKRLRHNNEQRFLAYMACRAVPQNYKINKFSQCSK